MTNRGRALSAVLYVALSGPALLYSQQRPRRFEAEIERMLERDKSSIFRLWTQLSEQMAPLPVFNRAFGGSVTQDMLDRMDQVVLPYRPRITVYYCGSNDRL